VSAVGQFSEEQLRCGCVLRGTRNSSKPFDGDFHRSPCRAHTKLGACALCRSGGAHPACGACGLSDGRHASWCLEES
jgi:hypothetical protein